MTRQGDYSFSQFNFTVTWDRIDGTTAEAGFQEASGLGMEIGMAEYRSGNANTKELIKVAGHAKTTEMTFKRGVIGAQDLYEWLNLVRDGHQSQFKTVTITQLNESREKAMRWRLLAARPIKYNAPLFNGKGTEIAIEELVLCAECIEQKAA